VFALTQTHVLEAGPSLKKAPWENGKKGIEKLILTIFKKLAEI
jgi:hypothetical protein